MNIFQNKKTGEIIIYGIVGVIVLIFKK